MSTFSWIIFFWFGISIPIVYVGAYLCEKSNKQKRGREGLTPPVQINQIPRQIPYHPWYLQAMSRYDYVSLNYYFYT